MKHVDYRDAIGTYIKINKKHITKTDWNWIVATRNPTERASKQAWKAVPPEDVDHYEQLVRDGCSFSYASILQQCRRNGIDWILFDSDAPVIKGLKLYEYDWS